MLAAHLLGCDRELKDSVFASKILVNMGEGLSLVLSVSLILGVEVNFHHPCPVDLVPRPTADNLSRVYHILQDGVMDGGQGTRARALLGIQPAILSLAWDDLALRDNDNVLSGELLL